MADSRKDDDSVSQAADNRTTYDIFVVVLSGELIGYETHDYNETGTTYNVIRDLLKHHEDKGRHIVSMNCGLKHISLTVVEGDK